MNEHNNRPYIIELYGVLPTVVALLILGAFRNEDLSDSIRWIFIGVLALAIIALLKSTALFFVGVATVLEKAYFHHPLTSYICALLVGIGLVASTEKDRQPRVFRAALFVLGLGLAPILLPKMAMLLFLLLSAAAAASFVFAVSMSVRTEILSNPLAHLVADPNNRDRFGLFCLSFLSFGTLTWGYVVGIFPGAPISAAVHCIVSLLAIPFLLHLLGLRAINATKVVELSSKSEQLVLGIRTQEKRLEEVTRNAQELEQGYEQAVDSLQAELNTRQEKFDRDLEERARTEEEQLARRKREADAELQSNYFSQPFDALATHLCGKDSVRIPGGPTLNTKDHILIGTREQVNGTERKIEPVFLHKSILRNHIHILGGTGYGKTSRGIAPLSVQLLRDKEPSPLIFLDLKGERSLFHTIREEAERANRDFLFFSLESHKATYRFNPFVAIKSYGGTKNEQAQPLLDALGLNHGEGYGRSFFTRIHRQRLFEALAHNPNIHSFAQLKEALNGVAGIKPSRRPVPVSSQKDELIAAIEGVADYPQLFTTPDEEEAGTGIIQFDKVFAKNQVVYFWLPAPTQSISVREIGKLVLYNLFFAALKLKNAGQKTQAYLFIDEFQRLIGENLALFLEQSRSYGIGLTLANQNIEQLNGPDAKLWPLVQSNVRASLHFGSGDLKETELLSQAFGESIAELSSFTNGSSTGTSHGRSRATTTTESRSVTTAYGTSSGTSEGVSQNFTSGRTTSEGTHTGTSESISHGRVHGTSDSEGQSESSSQGESAETTRTEYVRAALRPEDIASVFNKDGQFIYWVRRGVPPLVDFDGKPIVAKGFHTVPYHLNERRDSTAWPKLPSVPGDVVQTPAEYKQSNVVTEKVIVDELLSVLKED
jgi:hypothetical protein